MSLLDCTTLCFYLEFCPLVIIFFLGVLYICVCVCVCVYVCVYSHWKFSWFTYTLTCSPLFLILSIHLHLSCSFSSIFSSLFPSNGLLILLHLLSPLWHFSTSLESPEAWHLPPWVSWLPVSVVHYDSTLPCLSVSQDPLGICHRALFSKFFWVFQASLPLLSPQINACLQN